MCGDPDINPLSLSHRQTKDVLEDLGSLLVVLSFVMGLMDIPKWAVLVPLRMCIQCTSNLETVLTSVMEQLETSILPPHLVARDFA